MARNESGNGFAHSLKALVLLLLFSDTLITSSMSTTTPLLTQVSALTATMMSYDRCQKSESFDQHDQRSSAIVPLAEHSRKGLLSLPGEIRNLIYHYLTQTYPARFFDIQIEPRLIIPVLGLPPPLRSWHDYALTNHMRSLTKTCRELRTEYLPIYRRNRSMQIDSSHGISRFLLAFFPLQGVLDEIVAGYISNLTILIRTEWKGQGPIDLLPLVVLARKAPLLQVNFQIEQNGGPSDLPNALENGVVTQSQELTETFRRLVCQDISVEPLHLFQKIHLDTDYLDFQITGQYAFGRPQYAIGPRKLELFVIWEGYHKLMDLKASDDYNVEIDHDTFTKKLKLTGFPFLDIRAVLLRREAGPDRLDEYFTGGVAPYRHPTHEDILISPTGLDLEYKEP
ncbi:hypothetical protein BDV96DRAFT_567863 [Lophiotrema nucula]|uniref:F-box domain-containing protein n=1 Tax=Lophiotrema nucula TaxID=690887 RepID=A0A6A5ZJ62_9PLEO|nr:hypothetical protein BDV96DRAFT_567863 [Lophiotrema nucula]